MTGEPGPAVLADLLVLAAEAGVDRLAETDRLLRDLVGNDATSKAHRVWTNRLRAAVEARSAGILSDRVMKKDSDVFELIRAIRETTPPPPRAPR